MNKEGGFFRGAVMEARFTDSALTPDQFLKVPAVMDAPDPPPGAGRGGRRGGGAGAPATGGAAP
jgi:hypothetical protein